MSSGSSHRLDGLEADNLLAFLALLGLLRAIEIDDRDRPPNEKLCPRAAWDIDTPPLRPRLFIAAEVSADEVAERAAPGVAAVAQSYEFGGRKDLNHSQDECRVLLADATKAAGAQRRDVVDLLAALMTDAATKDEKDRLVDPTPLCLLFGQGHQHFLDRLSKVPREPAPSSRGRGAAALTAAQCLGEALFAPWHRKDATFSFRWDPDEDVRYALMAGDPTDNAYKTGTQHGANRLAAIGLATLTIAPGARAGRVRPSVVGGAFGRDGFSFAWPIWRDAITLSAIRALLAHPGLRTPMALAHLGVEYVMAARRISVGKFMNFTRARPLLTKQSVPTSKPVRRIIST